MGGGLWPLGLGSMWALVAALPCLVDGVLPLQLLPLEGLEAGSARDIAEDESSLGLFDPPGLSTPLLLPVPPLLLLFPLLVGCVCV